MTRFLDVPNENVFLCSSCQEKLGGELQDRYEKMIVTFFIYPSILFSLQNSVFFNLVCLHTIISLRDS